METVICKDKEIKYVITKKGTKNLNARMDSNNVIRISVPYFISKKSIEKFVIDSYEKLIQKSNKRKNKNVINDGKVKILGVEKNIDEIQDLNFTLIVTLKRYLKDNYLNIVRELGIYNPPSVILKRVKGYLGQYNKKNHMITLNILLAHLDEECIKYVIIHELSHIKYMNHQQEFWQEVSKYMPHYKKLRNKCKKEFVYYENN